MSEAVEVSVPDSAARLKLLDHVDYQDAYRVDAPILDSAERWMRAFLQYAPRWPGSPFRRYRSFSSAL